MTTSRPGLTGMIATFVGVVVTVLIAGPPLYSVMRPAAPQAVDCPARPEELAGHHFATTDDLIQAELTCADLRNAVFDGLDLTQANLAGADLRGASLRHTSLIQADLSQARLGGADLSFADLTQADLSGADVRGARLWLTGSIQADTNRIHIGTVERGTLQLGYLFVAAALVLLGRPLVRLAARRPAPAPLPGRRLRPRVRRLLMLALVAPVAAFLLKLVVGGVAALWMVDTLRPLLIGEAILLAALLAEQFAPALRRHGDGRDLFPLATDDR